VDAGPASEDYDAGERRVVPYLKRHGARRIDALVLTHPHLDHIGGARAVLEAFEVGGVLDPSRTYGSPEHAALVGQVAASGGSWWTAEAGRTFRMGDARVTIVHPGPSLPDRPPPSDPNDVSIVLLVEWENASILLTGDAPASVEAEMLDRLEALLARRSGPLGERPGERPAEPSALEPHPLTVLKLGHHGSRTSTSANLLDRTRPAVAIASMGEGNSFGHPHEEVTARLEGLGTPLYRTDRDGAIRVRIGPGGGLAVRTSR
jgi:competence protein ComEC